MSDAIELVAKAIYKNSPFSSLSKQSIDGPDGLPPYWINVIHKMTWDEYERPEKVKLDTGEIIPIVALRLGKEEAWNKYKDKCRYIAAIAVDALKKENLLKASNE